MIPGITASGVADLADPFDEAVLALVPTAFWPTQGVQAEATQDVVGSLHFTTVTGGPTFQATGPFGWDAITFDGVNDLIYTALTSVLPASGQQFSSIVWHKTGSTATGRTMMAIRPDVDNEETMLLLHNWPAAGNYRAYRNGDFSTPGQGTTADDNNWRMLAHVVNGNNNGYRLYDHGTLIATADTSEPTTGVNSRVILGANRSGSLPNGIQFCNISLTKPAVWKGTALTEAQIDDLIAAAGS